ncbi:MAG: hypothetical protein K8U03_25760 [Planctomycetia bacterium]|nr:hypothetical protein [Planctomycetia bacterium]
MYLALVVSNIIETPRWITEYVLLGSKEAAQPLEEGIAWDEMPEGAILGSNPLYPPDGRTVDPFSAVAVPFTSPSEAQAVAVAEAFRKSPPDEMKRYNVTRATPIYVVDRRSQRVKPVAV